MKQAAILALGLTLFSTGCASLAPPREPIAVVPPGKPPKKALTMRERSRIDQTFYKAVDSYMRGDYEDCRLLLQDILRISPFEKDALQLRARLDAVERAATASTGR